MTLPVWYLLFEAGGAFHRRTTDPKVAKRFLDQRRPSIHSVERVVHVVTDKKLDVVTNASEIDEYPL